MDKSFDNDKDRFCPWSSGS